MKQSMRMWKRMAAVLGIGLLTTGSAWAGTLFWDAATNYDSGAASGGTGTWDTATANWWRTNAPAQNVLWSDPLGQDVATFGTLAGIVSIVGTVNVNQLTFSVTKYVLTNGTINLTGSHTITPGSAGYNASVYSTIQGSAGLLVTGNGALYLFGTNNTYSGGTVLNSQSGQLYFQDDGSLGAVPTDATATNITMSDGTSLWRANIAVNATVHSNRTLALTGASASFICGGSGQLTFSNRIVSTTARLITFDNYGSGGTLLVANPGNNWPTGATNLVGRKSVLKIGVDNAIPTNTIIKTASAVGSVNYYGTFDLNGHNQTIAGLISDSCTQNIGSVANNLTNTVATLTMTGTSTFDGTLVNFAGQGVTKGGVLALTKSTAGTLTLTMTNTYTGATTITGGTLALGPGGLISSSTVFSVSAGAAFDVSSQAEFLLASNRTLQGNGLVLGSVNAATNSSVSPGLAGPGTLTVNGNLKLFGRLAADVNAATGANDLLAVGTNLTLNAGCVLALTTNGAFSAAQHYTLATYGGTLAGTFGSVSNLPPKFRIDYGTGVNSAIRLLGPPGGSTIFLR